MKKSVIPAETIFQFLNRNCKIDSIKKLKIGDEVWKNIVRSELPKLTDERTIDNYASKCYRIYIKYRKIWVTEGIGVGDSQDVNGNSKVEDTDLRVEKDRHIIEGNQFEEDSSSGKKSLTLENGTSTLPDEASVDDVENHVGKDLENNIPLLKKTPLKNELVRAKRISKLMKKLVPLKKIKVSKMEKTMWKKTGRIISESIRLKETKAKNMVASAIGAMFSKRF